MDKVINRVIHSYLILSKCLYNAILSLFMMEAQIFQHFSHIFPLKKLKPRAVCSQRWQNREVKQCLVLLADGTSKALRKQTHNFWIPLTTFLIQIAKIFYSLDNMLIALCNYTVWGWLFGGAIMNPNKTT